jgi:hypothetical protein
MSHLYKVTPLSTRGVTLYKLLSVRRVRCSEGESRTVAYFLTPQKSAWKCKKLSIVGILQKICAIFTLNLKGFDQRLLLIAQLCIRNLNDTEKAYGHQRRDLQSDPSRG